MQNVNPKIIRVFQLANVEHIDMSIDNRPNIEHSLSQLGMSFIKRWILFIEITWIMPTVSFDVQI